MTRKTNKTYKQTGSVMNYVRKAALYHKKASWVEGKLHLGAFITVERHVNDQPNSICYHNIDLFTCFVDHIPQILQACLRCDHCVIKKKKKLIFKKCTQEWFYCVIWKQKRARINQPSQDCVSSTSSFWIPFSRMWPYLLMAATFTHLLTHKDLTS